MTRCPRRKSRTALVASSGPACQSFGTLTYPDIPHVPACQDEPLATTIIGSVFTPVTSSVSRTGPALGWLLCACTGPTPADTPPVEAPPPQVTVSLGWVEEVAHHPERFGELVEADRTGWTALHAHDYGVARANLSTPAHRARADLALATLHDDLAHLSAAATSRLFPAWEDRGGLPDDSSARAIATLAAWCAPQAHDRPAEAWARDIPGDRPGHVLTETLSSTRPLLELTGDGPYAKRMALHRRARSGDTEALEVAAALPLISEQAHGFTRHFYDPCAHASLAEGWWHVALRALEADADPLPDRRALEALGSSLPATLFSPWLSDTGRTEAGPLALFGADAPWPGSGVAALPAGDVEAAREAVRDLDERLDGARRALLADAPPEGAGVLSDLDLVLRWRQEWLVLQARKHLRDDDPTVALALLERAHDPSHPEVGPWNSPSLFVLRAEAEVRSGRTRQALDALRPVEGRLGSVRGVIEIVGDLAVLQGLDRRGDSKESQ